MSNDPAVCMMDLLQLCFIYSNAMKCVLFIHPAIFTPAAVEPDSAGGSGVQQGDTVRADQQSCLIQAVVTDKKGAAVTKVLGRGRIL